MSQRFYATWYSVFGMALVSCLTICQPTAVLAYQNQNIRVCTMTFNSDNEGNVFKKNLSAQLPGRVVFEELTALIDQYEDNNEEGWLPGVCRKMKLENKKCDILLISGHFAGSFSGETAGSLSLPLEHLERGSCSDECDGILKSPKEVYLFGCNTLAGKEQDVRTPDQYRRVLIEHVGMTPEQAQTTTLFRYSNFGDSNKNRMTRVFRNTPLIYGFDSIGPSGKTIEPFLNMFFKQTPNYLSNLRTSIDARKNITLQKVLSKTAYTSASGKNYQTNFPYESKLQSLICAAQTSEVDFVKQFRGLVDQGIFIELFPQVLDLASSNPKEATITELKKLASSKTLRKYVLDLEKAFAGDAEMTMKLYEFASLMNWLTREQSQSIYSKIWWDIFSKSAPGGHHVMFFEGINNPPSLVVTKAELDKANPSWKVLQEIVGPMSLLKYVSQIDQATLSVLLSYTDSNEAADAANGVLLKSARSSALWKHFESGKLTVTQVKSLIPALLKTSTPEEFRSIIQYIDQNPSKNEPYGLEYMLERYFDHSKTTLSREHFNVLIDIFRRSTSPTRYKYLNYILTEISFPNDDRVSIKNNFDISNQELLIFASSVFVEARKNEVQPSGLSYTAALMLVQLGHRSPQMKSFFVRAQNVPHLKDPAEGILENYF